MKGSVSFLIFVVAGLLLAPVFAQNAEKPLDAPSRDYTLSVLEFNSMIKEGMSAYKKKKYDEAFPILYQMALWGEKDCQWTVGLMYYEGLGVSENVLEAYAWMKTAAESGIRDWEDTVKRLHKSLPDQHKDYVDQYADEYIRLYGMDATGVRCEEEGGGGRSGVRSRSIECHRPVSINQSTIHLTPPVEIATN